MAWQDAEKPATDVTPAKAGVQKSLKSLDSRFRGNDDPRKKSNFSATCYSLLSFAFPE
jgi:hypothetical protein